MLKGLKTLSHSKGTHCFDSRHLDVIRSYLFDTCQKYVPLRHRVQYLVVVVPCHCMSSKNQIASELLLMLVHTDRASLVYLYLRAVGEITFVSGATTFAPFTYMPFYEAQLDNIRVAEVLGRQSTSQRRKHVPSVSLSPNFVCRASTHRLTFWLVLVVRADNTRVPLRERSASRQCLCTGN